MATLRMEAGPGPQQDHLLTRADLGFPVTGGLERQPEIGSGALLWQCNTRSA